MDEVKVTCLKCENEIKWYDFMFSKEFQFFMNVIKILAFIVIVFLAYTAYTEIEAVKFLNYDQCSYCIEKTGATCFLGNIGLGQAPTQEYFNETELEEIFSRIDISGK